MLFNFAARAPVKKLIVIPWSENAGKAFLLNRKNSLILEKGVIVSRKRKSSQPIVLCNAAFDFFVASPVLIV